MEYIVKIHTNNGTLEKTARAGSNLLELLQQESIDLNSHCSGKGTCGKCCVKISGDMSEAGSKEKKLLGAYKLSQGYRLACYCNVDSDMDVFLENKALKASILTEGKTNRIKVAPLITKECRELESSSIDYQASDDERILSSFNKTMSDEALELLRKIPGVLSDNDSKVTVCCRGNEITGVESGNTLDRFYGVAIDIGTTTIAAYLYNLNNGRRISVKSSLNPQKRYGADVISRIEYSSRSSSNKDEMNKVLIEAINSLISEFVSENNINSEDIYMTVCVGNTSMLHFLMNLSADKIAVSPFIPVTTGMHHFKAASLGININPSGYIVLFPCVSAYIGADTVSAVLASRMFNSEETCLLIDIGTNGEMVLGCKKWMLSCSTAAGPAFEGSNIRNGTGGVEGAIDKVYIENGIKYSTIGNKTPSGLCGSGIIDAVAVMLRTGIIDETGRIINRVEAEESMPENIKDRLTVLDNQKAFIIEKGANTQNGTDIVITQKDVREVQNAKAAIAAGIKTLAKHAGLELADIKKVYLAGGFGNHMNIESAVGIGLIPDELRNKVEFIGNAAGTGAVEGLLSKKLLEKTLSIKKHIKYVELSASIGFSEEYIENMIFEADMNGIG